jgi:hypothetical protein
MAHRFIMLWWKYSWWILSLIIAISSTKILNIYAPFKFICLIYVQRYETYHFFGEFLKNFFSISYFQFFNPIPCQNKEK